MTRRSPLPRLFLAILLFASPLAALRAPSDYRFETLAGGACQGSGEPVRAVLSLAELERLARGRQEQGRSTADLTLGGMTTLEAVSWDRARGEIVLEGRTGECAVEPILLDAFIEALRIADAPSMWMSLEPERQGREVRHHVEYFPPELANTHLLASMTKADYFLKALLLRAVETPFEEFPSVQEILDCRAPDQLEPETYRHQSRNVFIYGLPPEVTLSADGKTVHLKQSRLLLRHGNSPSLLTREFSRAFNQRYPSIEQAHPRVFRGIRNSFMLYHVADLLRQWARGYDFSYWLRDYPLQVYPVPRELPAPVPRKVARFCSSPGEGVYTLGRVLAGGAVTEARFHWDLPDMGPGVAGVFSDGDRVLVLERSGKASLVSGSDGDEVKSGSYTRGSGTIRSTVGAEVLDLRLSEGGVLEGPEGVRWVPWLSLEDGTDGWISSAPTKLESAGFEEKDAKQDPNLKSTEDAQPSAEQQPASASLESPRWVRTPFRSVSHVRAAKPPGSSPVADGSGTSCPARDVLDLLQHGDLKEAAETLSRPSGDSGPCTETAPEAFQRSWTLAEVRDRLGDFKGATEAAQLADVGVPDGADPKALAFLEESGGYFQKAGKYNLALERYESCRDRLEAAGRQKDPQYLRCLTRIAGLYSQTYDFQRAEDYFRSAATVTAGTSDLEALDLLDETRGWYFIRRGSFAAALKLFGRRLRALRQEQPADSIAVAEALAAVARCHTELLEKDRAAELLREAIKLLEHAKLLHHPTYGWMLNDLAVLEMDAANPDDPESLLQRAFDLARQYYGIDHPNTLTAMNNLALMYGDRGKLRKAVQLLDHALEILEAAAWEDFAQQARLIGNRAIYAYLLGKQEWARSEMERAVAIARHALGERHPDFARAIAGLAAIEGLLGHYAKANELWEQSVSLRQGSSASDEAFATLQLRLQALKALARDR